MINCAFNGVLYDLENKEASGKLRTCVAFVFHITVGQRNYFTIFFCTSRQFHIIISGINNGLFNASCDCGKVWKITLLLPLMNNTANKGSW